MPVPNGSQTKQATRDLTLWRSFGGHFRAGPEMKQRAGYGN